mgnify:CR=1 FL=1
MSIVAVHSGEIAKPRKNTVTVKPDSPITMIVEEDHRHQPCHGENPAAGDHQRTRNLQAPGAAQQSKSVSHPADQLGETSRRTAAPCKGMPIS